MAKTFKIPFAFDKDKKLYDYKTAIKGIDYICQCGETVRIRGGEIISNHFYHINETECSNESIIHKAYKSVFLEEKKIKLPTEYNGDLFIEFDRVELEKRINDFQPDAIGYKDGDMYLIEFAKTSFINENKLKKIKHSNLFCLEVSILINCTTIDDIKNHLLNDKYYKDIINAPSSSELEEIRQKAREYLISVKTKYNKKYTELEKRYTHKLEVADKFKKSINNMIYNGERIEFKTVCKNGSYLYSSEDVLVFINHNEGYANVKFNKKIN